MSFRINSYEAGRDDSRNEAGMRAQLPFPTEAWRTMLTPSRRAGDTTAPRRDSARTPHPAEIALAEVEKHFARTVISINEAMDAQSSEDSGSDGWRPRAA